MAAPVISQADQDRIMLERNLQGIEMERSGHIAQAVTLYEANVRDCFEGSHPYERLRVIYRQIGDYPNAIRACQAYLNLPRRAYDEKKRQRFREHIAKLTEEGRRKSTR